MIIFQILLGIGFTIAFFYVLHRLTNPKEEFPLWELLPFLSPFRPDRDPLFSKGFAYHPSTFAQNPQIQDWIETQNWRQLLEIPDQTRESWYTYFDQQKNWRKGAEFASFCGDLQATHWFYGELMWRCLEKQEFDQALHWAEKGNFVDSAFLLFEKLFPEGGKWLQRGELAMKAGQYQKAFDSFVQGNEIREATKAAVKLKSMEHLLQLTENRNQATIKVCVLDPLEELGQFDLRTELIQILKKAPPQSGKALS